MAQSRPDLFLWEDWAVIMDERAEKEGISLRDRDAVLSIIDKARLRGPRLELSDRIIVKGQPVIEIYHRIYENPGSLKLH